jgi:ZIP family zinc transporter
MQQWREPLPWHGVSRWKSFWYGQLSAIVEPIAGVLGAMAVVYMQPVLPFALAFAAGAMLYVVVEEVIPETQRDKYTDVAVMGFMGGFVIMMILDVALG